MHDTVSVSCHVNQELEKYTCNIYRIDNLLLVSGAFLYMSFVYFILIVFYKSDCLRLKMLGYVRCP